MAETFPFFFASPPALPVSPIISDRDESGLIITVRRGEAYWAGTFATGKLSPAEYAEACAFLDYVVDNNLRVDWSHPRHRVPRSYSLATFPGTGVGTVTAIPNLRQLTVSGYPIGLILKRGDRIGLVSGELRGYRMIAQDVTVTSTTAQTIRITPRLPLGVFAAGASAVVKNPVLRLAIVPNSWKGTEQYQPTALSFDVAEALR